jgi:hypothetical protein
MDGRVVWPGTPGEELFIGDMRDDLMEIASAVRAK